MHPDWKVCVTKTELIDKLSANACAGESSAFRQDVVDVMDRLIQIELADMANARATLEQQLAQAHKEIAELNETREILALHQERADDDAVIKAALCTTEQVEERIKLSVRACCGIATPDLRVASNARLDGLFKFKKQYDDKLTAAKHEHDQTLAREHNLKTALEQIRDAKKFAIVFDAPWCAAATGMCRIANQALVDTYADSTYNAPSNQEE